MEMAIRIGKTYTLASTFDMNDVILRNTVEDNNLIWHRHFGRQGEEAHRLHESTTGLGKPLRSLDNILGFTS